MEQLPTLVTQMGCAYFTAHFHPRTGYWRPRQDSSDGRRLHLDTNLVQQEHLNQAIQVMLGFSPVASVRVDQIPEVRAVVVMF